MKLNPVSQPDVFADQARQLNLTWTFDRSPASINEGILCHISYESEWEPGNKHVVIHKISVL